MQRGTDGLIEVSEDDSTWVLVASQQNWSLDQANETIDTTVLGAQRDRDNITTFRSWNMSADGFWDDEDLQANEGQEIVQRYMESGDPLYVRITPAATGGASEVAGDWYYSGQANVANNSPSGAFDTAIQNAMAFEGKGGLTFAQFA